MEFHWVSSFLCVFFYKYLSLPRQTNSSRVNKDRGDAGSSTAMNVFSLFVAIELEHAFQ